MLPVNKLNQVGEHPFFFAGGVGKVEAVLTVPPTVNHQYVAILGHPHSLQGGCMTNKVVTTLARAFKELGIASIRFNFRGVGASEGLYDQGIGESEDMLILQRQWAEHYPDCHFLFAGFSFGSFVAYRAAALCKAALLISVAPPVHHFNYREFLPAPTPWHIMQGDDDEVVPLALVIDFATQSSPTLPVTRFAETGHFFHGKLLLLKPAIMSIITTQVLNQ